MRLHSDSQLRFLITVYLDGRVEKNAVEAFIDGNNLEGGGYVVRYLLKDGKVWPTVMWRSVFGGELPSGLYDIGGAVCEKVFGHVRIEIADDRSVVKEDN